VEKNKSRLAKRRKMKDSNSNHKNHPKTNEETIWKSMHSRRKSNTNNNYPSSSSSKLRSDPDFIDLTYDSESNEPPHHHHQQQQSLLCNPIDNYDVQDMEIENNNSTSAPPLSSSTYSLFSYLFNNLNSYQSMINSNNQFQSQSSLLNQLSQLSENQNNILFNNYINNFQQQQQSNGGNQLFNLNSNLNNSNGDVEALTSNANLLLNQYSSNDLNWLEDQQTMCNQSIQQQLLELYQLQQQNQQFNNQNYNNTSPQLFNSQNQMFNERKRRPFHPHPHHQQQQQPKRIPVNKTTLLFSRNKKKKKNKKLNFNFTNNNKRITINSNSNVSKKTEQVPIALESEQQSKVVFTLSSPSSSSSSSTSSTTTPSFGSNKITPLQQQQVDIDERLISNGDIDYRTLPTDNKNNNFIDPQEAVKSILNQIYNDEINKKKKKQEISPKKSVQPMNNENNKQKINDDNDEDNDANDDLSELRSKLLENMQRKRELKQQQEVLLEKSNKSPSTTEQENKKESEQMDEAILKLKQKLAEHEELIVKDKRPSTITKPSNQISPVIIRLQADADSDSDMDDYEYFDTTPQPLPPKEQQQPETDNLQQSIGLFLKQVQKVTTQTSNPKMEDSLMPLTNVTTSSKSLDTKPTTSIANSTNNNINNTIKPTLSSMNEIEKKKLILFIRDKINRDRYSFNALHSQIEIKVNLFLFLKK
jgi:hypothetical protein